MSDQTRAYKLRRWAKALRTTTATQIAGGLSDEDGGRCANGVCIDDLIADGIVPADWTDCDNGWALPAAFHAYTEEIRSTLNAVPVWNDLEDLTFAQIADHIDAEADRIDPIVRLVDQREAALALLP